MIGHVAKALGASALGAGLGYVVLGAFLLLVALRAMRQIEEAAAEARLVE
jgi:hypothetical protein